MKKPLTVVDIETVAFDDQIITMKSADATIKMHLHDSTEFDSYKRGDEVELSLSSGKVKVVSVSKTTVVKKKVKAPAKKVVAKTIAKKTAVKKPVLKVSTSDTVPPVV